MAFFTILLIYFPFALEINISPATSLEKDHAYVISALGLSSANTVDYISGDLNSEGSTYKLAPQVIVYDGTTKFIGTATKFTGCFNDIKYVDSVPSGGCGIIKVENITSENIKAGVTVSYGLENNTLTTVTGTFTSDANAYASGILSGLSAYVNGTKIDGTMTNNGAVSSSLNPGGSYTIPAGYHDGNGIVAANTDGDLVAGNIKSGVNIFGVTGTLTSLDLSQLGTMNNVISEGNWENWNSRCNDYVATATQELVVVTSYGTGGNNESNGNGSASSSTNGKVLLTANNMSAGEWEGNGAVMATGVYLLNKGQKATICSSTPSGYPTHLREAWSIVIIP